MLKEKLFAINFATCLLFQIFPPIHPNSNNASVQSKAKHIKDKTNTFLRKKRKWFPPSRVGGEKLSVTILDLSSFQILIPSNFSIKGSSYLYYKSKPWFLRLLIAFVFFSPLPS